jgi:acyl-CoA hydrolase
MANEATATRTRPLVAYPDGADSARVAPDVVARLAGVDHPQPDVLLGWTPEDRAWLGSERLRGTTVMAGYALASAVRDGRLRYVPARLSAVPHVVERVRPDVAVVSGIRRGSSYAYRGTVGWGPAATRATGRVVVEVDDDAPDLGAPLIDGDIVAVVARAGGAPSAAPRTCDDVDLAIGRRVASLLPDDATIQLGPGGIADAVVAGIERPVRVFSGLLGESTAALARRGLLSGTATAGYVWGDDAIVELARSGRLRLEPVEITHDITAVGALPRFVACNTALQVGLDGSVNVERVGTRVVAGIGGHADFSAAAARSPGGISVIALRSTDRRGDSTIVPNVDVVSTPRCDVDVVVTEHGVADLRDATDDERAARNTAVASPPHRDALAQSRT